jgi:hypothetical protein
MPVIPLKSPVALNAEHGTTLIELLVAMVSAIVVMLALVAILEFSTKQESRISESVQSNRTGRVAVAKVIDQLHSSCTGFGTHAIQGPSSAPTAPLASTGPLDLWYISAYGSPTSGAAVITTVYEHDIHWAATGSGSAGETLGTVTDYVFENKSGTGPGTPTGKWEFSALTVANAKARVVARNVIPPAVSGANTIFQYYKFSAATGEYVAIAEKIPAAATANEIGKVAISFTQAPETGTVGKGGRLVPFSDAVVLRFNSPEAGAEARAEPCT